MSDLFCSFVKFIRDKSAYNMSNEHTKNMNRMANLSFRNLIKIFLLLTVRGHRLLSTFAMLSIL